ncbi:MAG TPA: MarR family transcriptional regulator [Candidatus Limnocylindria bacterium]|nr:MarR family transcriptional regulator [Candidatus Limnocylindria bacterium]
MTHEQEILSALAKSTFRLNGRFLAIGEELARSTGLTASLWLVLGSVLREPRTVADIARDIGVARQSAQRTADLLVGRGLATYRPNPAHRRAKLLDPTPEGRRAIERIAPAHRAYARRLTDTVGLEEAERLLAALVTLDQALATVGTALVPTTNES